ncbi:integral membrane protein [Streptomyces davaonensis JCM 4913]|uniref:Integral membrane protein n=1 Tax=Streptomyces davaonensis (strain DSM 101723 / JCM 4913 / KCC S-0913 / 768) TaxID=1214101 RepID=K4R1R6_STRDJ|nr:hypothetical protein [Streptomyces davaonensis]CCK27278.1 integral membrane protein [Streptomyces davaonensis JCM 4913]
MGTKTVDETKTAEKQEAVEATEPADVNKTEDAIEADAEILENGDDSDDLAELTPDAQEGSSFVGQGAAAVVSAALGLVALTGSWVGTVAAARSEITGQLEMQAASNASVAQQLEAVYGDAWQTTALWGGAFALVALIVGVLTLARPAFGAPGQPQPVWIKSVSWAGVALGVIGLLLAVLKYTDVMLGLPSTS